jgi:hypothetical protein
MGNSPVPYNSESALRGDDLLDAVLEDIRLICTKYSVAILVRDHAADIVTGDEPIVKLGELLYVHEGRIGYTRTAYRRTTPPNPAHQPNSKTKD